MVNIFALFTRPAKHHTLTKDEYHALLEHIEQLNLEIVKYKDELNKLHKKYDMQTEKLVAYMNDMNMIEQKLNEALGHTIH